MTPLLETRGVSMRFGGVLAVNAVNLRVEEGELRCLIGPNGAGKTTFFKCLTGLLKPSSGSIFWRGRDITGLGTFAIARLGIGIKTQVPSLFDGLTVREGVALALRRTHDEAEAQARAAATLERLAIERLAEHQVGLLAHGERQLVELAMVIAPEPDLIILDEPTAGMSAEATDRTAALIRELNRRHAIIVVEHDMQFIRSIARRVTVFHQGEVLVDDTVERVLGDPGVCDVYFGKAATGPSYAPGPCRAAASA
jgi:branched-chain amino acid transport system ATP-binding protein